MFVTEIGRLTCLVYLFPFCPPFNINQKSDQDFKKQVCLQLLVSCRFLSCQPKGARFMRNAPRRLLAGEDQRQGPGEDIQRRRSQSKGILQLRIASNGHGPKPKARTVREHPNPTTKIGSKMGGEFTYPKMVPLVLTHSQIIPIPGTMYQHLTHLEGK